MNRRIHRYGSFGVVSGDGTIADMFFKRGQNWSRVLHVSLGNFLIRIYFI